jgi:FAD/FMN-containing dehydrogenase
VATHPVLGVRALVLLVGQEFNTAEESEGAEQLQASSNCDFVLGTRSYPMWSSNGTPGHGFFRVFGKGKPGSLNPWVEYLFPPESIGAALDATLDPSRIPSFSGKTGIIAVRRGAAPAPLFITPTGELLLGIGFFLEASETERASAETHVRRCADELADLGGKRYLSGHFSGMTRASWAEHYGDAWAFFRGQKKHRDADSLLNLGFITWD